MRREAEVVVGAEVEHLGVAALHLHLGVLHRGDDALLFEGPRLLNGFERRRNPI